MRGKDPRRLAAVCAFILALLTSPTSPAQGQGATLVRGPYLQSLPSFVRPTDYFRPDT